MWITDSMEIEEFFVPLFKRVNKHTNMKGVKTPNDIKKKMNKTAKAYDTALKTGYIDSDKVKQKFFRAKQNLKNLNKTDFAKVAVARANKHPDGIESLTFQFGYPKAREILLKNRRKLRGKKRRRRF